ncbi:MAG TPA: hypothetical protein VGC76_14450 [Pyrinomonadaceae bacterium]|jgi:hypothetical protein
MTYLFFSLLGSVLLFPVLVKFMGDVLKNIEKKLPDLSEEELQKSQTPSFQRRAV